MDKESPPSSAPEPFEFVGIWDGKEQRRSTEKSEKKPERKPEKKRKREELEQVKPLKRVQRSPSPRESWFEMNHPMGWWHQDGLDLFDPDSGPSEYWF